MTGLVLFAPNVHTGGGLVLLQSLLKQWPENLAVFAILDRRACDRLTVPAGMQVYWSEPTLRSRWNAQKALYRAARLEDIILCFHGLPPIRRLRGMTVVFLQNRNYLGLNSLRSFDFKTGLRLGVERIIAKLFRKNVDRYIVQTPAMQRLVQDWIDTSGPSIGTSPRVEVMPFRDPIPLAEADTKLWDFIYVADGVAHKNHSTLLRAWIVLAQQNIFPTMAWTLSDRDAELIEELQRSVGQFNLKIHNLGEIDHSQIPNLYATADALIFPSLSESFGLPLIEAAEAGLPIIAGELDYVRDVCVPTQTFDPASPTSIASAVMRFLGIPKETMKLLTPSDFISHVKLIGKK